MTIAGIEFSLLMVLTELLGPNMRCVTATTQTEFKEGTKEEKSISIKRFKVVADYVDITLISSQNQSGITTKT